MKKLFEENRKVLSDCLSDIIGAVVYFTLMGVLLMLINTLINFATGAAIWVEEVPLVVAVLFAGAWLGRTEANRKK